MKTLSLISRKLLAITESALLIVILICFADWGLLSHPVLANADQLTISHAAGNAVPSVTILVLDMSGSMSENDPQGLRCSAANAYIDLSREGSLIGVVGLNNKDGAKGGKHNFQLAQKWADPIDMSTLNMRNSLKQVIVASSNNCRPDNTTPTYEALNEALTMLKRVALPEEYKGSVILLTDGEPSNGGAHNVLGSTKDQVNAIVDDLLPQFKQNGWPIDTIALGKDRDLGAGTKFKTYHDFLKGVANATSGAFYDNANGVITGQPSPFNIAPFFIDIFARRNQRTVNDDIPLTQLNGGRVARNFDVTDYTDNLDIVVIKDQPATKIELRDPNGNIVTQQAGIFVTPDDQYYQIFSIQRPRTGKWELVVTGSGQFLMKSLKTTAIEIGQIGISQAGLSAPTNAALALGQSITITTHITHQGNPITVNDFNVEGTIAYNIAESYQQDFKMKAQQGTYTSSITVPKEASAGSYVITINVGTASLAQPIASQVRTVRLELFPEPILYSQQGQPQGTTQSDPPVSATAVQWDPLLQWIYGSALPWLGNWPLQGLPARQEAPINGRIELRQQPYEHALVKATTISGNAGGTIPVQVVDDGGARFHVLVPTTTSGLYTITFQTQGDFQDSHGDFGIAQRKAQITVMPASVWQEARAWAVTLLYLLLLLFLIQVGRFSLVSGPFGSWIESRGGEVVSSHAFNRSRRGLWQSFIRRNILTSREAGLPPGLLFQFRRGGGIEVRADGGAHSSWFRSDDGLFSQVFQEARELRYQPANDEPEEEPALFLITARSADTYAENDDDDPGLSQQRRRGRVRNHRDYDDDYDTDSRARRGRKEVRNKRARQENRRKRYDDYDDDDW